LRGGEGCEIGRVGVADARGGWGAGVKPVGGGVLYILFWWSVVWWVVYLGEKYGGEGGPYKFGCPVDEVLSCRKLVSHGL
jgi:hypothetical protein